MKIFFSNNRTKDKRTIRRKNPPFLAEKIARVLQQNRSDFFLQKIIALQRNCRKNRAATLRISSGACNAIQIALQDCRKNSSVALA